jgi:Rrf2 family iron-sulfur cluster assembly transcriptional regulator
MRLEVTQRADLAVQALVVLHRSSTRLKSADLAVALETTAGFVPSAGYDLVRDVEKLNVLEAIETSAVSA